MLVKPKFGNQEVWDGRCYCQNSWCPHGRDKRYLKSKMIPDNPEAKDPYLYCTEECRDIVQGKNTEKIYDYEPKQLKDYIDAKKKYKIDTTNKTLL